MSFNVPTREETPTLGTLPEGNYPATLTGVEATHSNSGGDPQIIFTYTVDAGKEKGKTVRDYATFSEKGSTMAFASINQMAEAAGIDYDTGSFESHEEFAEEFRREGIRVELEVQHSHSVKEGESYVNLTKKEYENYSGPGERMDPRANVRGVYETDEAPDMTFGAPGRKGEPVKKSAKGAPSGDGAPSSKSKPPRQTTDENAFAGDPDDEVPF